MDCPDPVLVVPPAMWSRFAEALVAPRLYDEEVLGFLFCTRHRVGRRERYLAKLWSVPAPHEFDYQSSDGLSLGGTTHADMIETYVLGRGLHPVHVHTHPGHGPVDFSAVDDESEAEYALALSTLPGRPRLISGVLDGDLDVGGGRFRLWTGRGDNRPQPVALQTTWVPQVRQTEDGESDPDREFLRRQSVFGRRAQSSLAALTVGLVGCGGIGAAFAEQAARLGIRSWVLFDDDHLEPSNLNRMPFATPRMAHQHLAKARYVKTLIHRLWDNEARVSALEQDVRLPSSLRRLSKVDLIVVATDNHASRLAAMEIGLRYLRPVVCLGTHIEALPGDESPRPFARVTIPPLDGGWCLACAHVIDVHQAAVEESDPITRREMQRRGYLEDVPAPAVYWINNLCASAGVGLIHQLIVGSMNADDGLDWVFDFNHADWLSLRHPREAGCWMCDPFGEFLAGADATPGTASPMSTAIEPDQLL